MTGTHRRRPKTCLVLCPRWSWVSPPLGPALLKSFLDSRGYETATLDLGPLFMKSAPKEIVQALGQGDVASLSAGMQSKLLIAALLLRMSKTVDEALGRILACEPDVVGFSAYHSTWHMSIMLAERLKALNPRISIVLGGPEGSRYSDLKGNPMGEEGELDAVDAIVPGEGEIPLLNLLSSWTPSGVRPCPGAWVKADGRLVWTEAATPVQELDSLPFPDYTAFDFADYGNARQLVTYFSRGCFKKCDFCTVENIWKNWRNRSGARVFEEVEHLLAHHPGISDFMFGDSLVNANMKELLKFCELMRQRARRSPPVTWRGYAVVRPDMTPAACETMGASGCADLWFGIESGSQRILDIMKKGYRVAAADAVLRNCREAGISTSVLLMVGHPAETPDDFENTLAFIRRNAANISRIGATYTAIEDGTPLREKAFSAYGVAEKNFHTGFWESRDGSNTFPMRFKRLETLCRCAREAGITVQTSSIENARWAAFDKWNTAERHAVQVRGE